MTSMATKIQEFKERFGNQVAIPGNKESIERRRKNVWEMSCEGVPHTTMAKILGVSRVTIYSDVDFIRKEIAYSTKVLKNNHEYQELDIGSTCKKLTTISEQAMAQYAEAVANEAPALDKVSFLKVAMQAEALRTKVLVDTGVLPKAGVEVKQTVQHTVSFEERFGKYKVMDDANSRRKIMAVAEAALKFGLQNSDTSPEKTLTVSSTEVKSEQNK